MADETADPQSALDEADPLAIALAAADASWDDPGSHAKVLALGDALDRLSEVGKHYRSIERNDEARAAMAKRQIDALLVLAMARVARTEKTNAKPAKSRVEWIAFGVSATLIAAAIWSVLRGM